MAGSETPVGRLIGIRYLPVLIDLHCCPNVLKSLESLTVKAF